MTHLDDDKLLELHLDLLPEAQAQELRNHLAQCEECHGRYQVFTRHVDLLGSVDVEVPTPVVPLPRGRAGGRAAGDRVSWLKAAVWLLLGFGTGFAAARLWAPEPLDIRGPRWSRSPRPAATLLFASCESVDTRVVIAEPKDR